MITAATLFIDCSTTPVRCPFLSTGNIAGVAIAFLCGYCDKNTFDIIVWCPLNDSIISFGFVVTSSCALLF